MTLIQFVQNYQDLSTDRGYQFKFFCDKCGSGYMTPFQTSAIGLAESALQIAGSLFGGVFNTIGNSAYQVQRAVGGPAHDAALAAAVQEGKQYFHQCTRCGHWVCPQVCWNEQSGLCEACAPNLQEEMAAAHARAKVNAAQVQLEAKAAKEDFVAGIDMGASSVLSASGSSAQAHGACSACGSPMAANVRFCPQCGAARAPKACGGCGAAIQPNTKFCGQCGAKVV